MPHARTVGELRAFLDELEVNWTQEDNEYLGKLEDQPICVPYFNEKGECKGYGPATSAHDVTGLGILIDEPAHHTVQVPQINAVFETTDGLATGTTEAPIKRIEQQDDGSFTAIIDHWPR